MALGYAMRIGLVFIHLALLTVCAVYLSCVSVPFIGCP